VKGQIQRHGLSGFYHDRRPFEVETLTIDTGILRHVLKKAAQVGNLQFVGQPLPV
jgi:hypothetical protein